MTELPPEIGDALGHLGLREQAQSGFNWIEATISSRPPADPGVPAYAAGDASSVTATASVLVLYSYLGNKSYLARPQFVAMIGWLLNEARSGVGQLREGESAWFLLNAQASTWPTAWSVWGLSRNGQATHERVGTAVNFLLSSQNTDGGWPNCRSGKSRTIYTFVTIKALQAYLAGVNLEARTAAKIRGAIERAAVFLLASGSADVTSTALAWYGSKYTANAGPRGLGLHSLSQSRANSREALRKGVISLAESPADSFGTLVPVSDSLPLAPGWSLLLYPPGVLHVVYEAYGRSFGPGVLKGLEWLERNWIRIDGSTGGWPDVQRDARRPCIYPTVLSLTSLVLLASSMKRPGAARVPSLIGLQKDLIAAKNRHAVVSAAHLRLRRMVWLIIPVAAVIGFALGASLGAISSTFQKSGISPITAGTYGGVVVGAIAAIIAILDYADRRKHRDGKSGVEESHRE